ncbi:radical SAM protein [Chloroflexota bacterium]
MSWQQIYQSRQLREHERGTVVKDWGGRLPVALFFPNTYYLGMSSLAIHALYQLWNARDDTLCERLFTDLTPIVSVESGSPADYFPVVAMTLSYEMDYFHVASFFRDTGIPPLAADRDETHPLIIAGGPAISANPEPLAPMLDAALIGEVEPAFDSLTDALLLARDGRDAALAALRHVSGIYLPGRSISEEEPQPVVRQWLKDLDDYPTHSAMRTPDTEFGDMGLIEIARGCSRGCRFCLAGYAYRPPRQRSVESILAQARALMSEGDRLGLVSAAVSDHSDIDRLASGLCQMGARISVSSLRADSISESLVRALAQSGTQTVTIAPEAGSERLRQTINKRQSEDAILSAIELARRHGLPHLKLYFMLGLPTEDESDVTALVDLALACGLRFGRRVTVNITPFVPKAHTPFQRLPQTPAKIVMRRIRYVERELQRHGIAVKSESPAWAEIQGTLARGDSRLAEALLMDERVTPATWRRALEGAGVSSDEILRERSAEERLPWDFLQFPVQRG